MHAFTVFFFFFSPFSKSLGYMLLTKIKVDFKIDICDFSILQFFLLRTYGQKE
jgi:hypothetical protein